VISEQIRRKGWKPTRKGQKVEKLKGKNPRSKDEHRTRLRLMATAWQALNVQHRTLKVKSEEPEPR